MCLSTVYHIKNIKSIPNTVSFFASKANLILKEQKPPELICTLFTEPTGKEGIFMRYSYGFKRNAVELYREGLWPGTPKGVKEYNFRKMVRSWVRLEEAK